MNISYVFIGKRYQFNDVCIFEGFCSGGELAQLAKTKLLEKLTRDESVSFCAGVDQLGSLTAKTVAEAAKNGDALALDIFRIRGAFISFGQCPFPGHGLCPTGLWRWADG
jgi:hypothetical protein